MIQDSRIQPLNERPIVHDGRFVLYWMQQSQRTRLNHALEHAIAQANQMSLPLVVCFGVMDDYPEANERHYAFMLEGLAEVAGALAQRGIRFIMKHGRPDEVAVHYARRASLVVCDRGYTRHQKRWRDSVADAAECSVVQVESDVVVPVDVASDKVEFAARTIRPKIRKHLDAYLKPLRPGRVKHASLEMKIDGDLDPLDVEGTLLRLKLDRSVARSSRFRGGERHAGKLLKAFVKHRLHGYDAGRNEPAAGHTSTMSPYLHFGQISPLEIALSVKDAEAPSADRDAYIEELIVRRELSMNFVNFHPHYDSYDALPDWARRTLEQHRSDKRPILYTRQQLEAAQTYDRWWNAAQNEMVRTGYMHNYMRMYWGKKILEWSRTPREAYETTMQLNNRYFIDGRDPAGYANVAWIFGLHDRPWGERSIFGQVRYMNAAGLERKFDMEAYAAMVERQA